MKEIQIGTRFGKFETISDPYKTGHGRMVKCRCECGTIRCVPCGHLHKLTCCYKCEAKKRQIEGTRNPNWRGYKELSLRYVGRLIRGAEQRNFEYSVTPEYLYNLFLMQNRKCAISKMQLTLNGKQTASLDRIDSKKGYVEGNVQWVHKVINRIKMDMLDAEFIAWCHRISEQHFPEKLDFDSVLILPCKSAIKSRSEVNLFNNDTDELFYQTIPIIAANMNTTGCFTMAKALSDLGLMTCLHKHYTAEEYTDFFLGFDAPHRIFYSIGVSDLDFDKMKQVYELCGIKNICLDVANAYIPQTLDVVMKIRDTIKDCVLMVGNIATPEIIEDFAKSRVDILKCGIGSGGVCTTRLVAGIGVPQFSCILECTQEAKRFNIKVCSDGGCRTPADVVKGFAGGASMVMVGSMFAGAHECDGEWEEEYAWGTNGIPKLESLNSKRKVALKFYGMSSKEAMEKYHGEVADYRASEGRCTKIPYKGYVKDIVGQMLGGIRSACAYVGAHNLRELKMKANFIRCQQTHNHV